MTIRDPLKLEARRAARRLGHILGMFQPAGFIGDMVTVCKVCHLSASVGWNRTTHARGMWGRALREPCRAKEGA